MNNTYFTYILANILMNTFDYIFRLYIFLNKLSIDRQNSYNKYYD